MIRTKQSRFSVSLIAATLILLAPLPTTAASLSEDKQYIEIVEQSMDSALVEVGRNYNVVIIAPEPLTAGKTAPHVSGAMSGEDAIKQILQGSGLTIKRSEKGAFIITQPKPFVMDEIQVISTARTHLPMNALPMTVDVIGNEKLTNQVAISGSTADAVSALSTSFSPTREKATSFGETLRGRSPLYTINGVPQSTPIRSSSRASHTIDPFFVDRIELIYGSNSLQGIGATGGIINQVLVGAPEVDGISGRVLVQGSAHSKFKSDSTGSKIGGLVSYRNEAFDATIGVTSEERGAFYDGHGNRIGVDGIQGEIQDSTSNSFFSRLGYQLSDSTHIELVANSFELEGKGNYVRVDGNRATGTPSTSIRGKTPGKNISNRAELVSLQLTNDDLGGGTFTLQTFYNRSRFIFGGGVYGVFQDPAIDPTGNLFEQSLSDSKKLGGKVSYEREIADDLTVTLGFDSLFNNATQDLIHTGRYWAPEVDFRSIAPFAQLNLGLFDRLVTVAAGVRQENVKLEVDDYTTLANYGGHNVTGGSPSFREVLPNAGLILEPFEDVRIYASYSEGYTVPDIGRILRGVNVTGVSVDNFIDLTPVISDNRELGFEIKRGAFDASITHFWSSSKLGQRLVLNPSGIYDVRREAVEIKGLEIDLGMETSIPGLKLGLGYTKLSGEVDTDGDNKVDADLDGGNISPDRVNLSADYIKGPLTASLQGQLYLSRRFDGQPDSADFEGYNIFNGLVRYETDFGAISVAAHNLS